MSASPLPLFSPRGIVTLTTDFGLADGYVGAMKGVLLRLAPELRIVDVAHAVAAQDVRGGAATLVASAPYFPTGTVHLAVVDPGVGTERAAVVIAAGGHLLIGPDNGLLLDTARALAATDAGRFSTRRIDSQGALAAFLVPPQRVSATFHGRDLFAPVAAVLASGQLDPNEVGPEHSPASLPPTYLTVERDRLEAEVVRADHFGNLITSVPAAEVARLGPAATVEITSPGSVLRATLRHTYGDAAPGELLALISSDGWLEIAVRNGSARERLDAAIGTRVRVRARAPAANGEPAR